MSHDHEHPHTHPHEHPHAGEHSHTEEHAHDEGHSHAEDQGHDQVVVDGHAPTFLTREEQARRIAREDLLSLTDEGLADAHNDIWGQRRALTEKLVLMTEETIARAVVEEIPEAAVIVLYEDHSHDAPHGHVLHVLDADGHVLLEGSGDDWHEAGWTSDVDELIWDLFHLDRHGFVSRPEEAHHLRVRRIPTR